MNNRVRLDLNLKVRGGLTSANVHKLARALSDAGRRQINQAIGSELIALAEDTFGIDGQNRPEPWHPLSPKYQKAIGYYGPPTLVLTRSMFESFGIHTATSYGVTVTNSSDYAEEHQHGAPARNLPRRGFFPITLGGQLTDHAKTELNRAAQEAFDKMMI